MTTGGVLECIKNHLDRRGLMVEDVDHKCSNDEEIIAKIAAQFETWRVTAPYLNIGRAEIKEIQRDNDTERERKVAALHKWVEKKGDDATYVNLILAFLDDENLVMIDLVLDLLKEKKDRIDEGVDFESIKEVDIKFYCGCGQCTFDDYVANSCPNPWRSDSYPILNITTLPVRRKLELLSRLDQEYDEITEKFSVLVSCQILQAFRQKYGDDVTTVRKLTVFILAKQPFLFLEEEHRRRIQSGLHEAQTVVEVFEIITGNFISWFNHLLLGSITKVFGVAKEHYRNYVDNELVPFLQRSLFEIPKDSFSTENPEGSGSFVLKLEVTSSKEELQGSVLLPLRRHVAHKLGITIESFQVCSYISGCFELSVNGPNELLNAVFPLSEESLSDLGSLPSSCKGLKMASIEYQNIKQTISNSCIKPIDESHHLLTDIHSTPFSSVEHLFTSLLLKVLEQDENRLLQTLKNINVYRLSRGTEPLFRSISSSRLTNNLIQHISLFLSFINYTLLESILKPRYDDSDLRNYIRQLENLKITEIPPLLHHTKDIESFCPHLVVIEFHRDVKSVEDLNCIRQTFCNVHQLEQHSVILYSLDKEKRELGCLIVETAERSVMEMPHCSTLFSNRLKESKVVRVSFKESVLLDLSNVEDDSGMSSGTMSEDDSPLRLRSRPQQTIPFEPKKLDLKDEPIPQEPLTFTKKEKENEAVGVAPDEKNSPLVGSLYDDDPSIGQSDRSSISQPSVYPSTSQEFYDSFIDHAMSQPHYMMYYPPPLMPPMSPSLAAAVFHNEAAINSIGAGISVVSPESHLEEEWPDIRAHAPVVDYGQNKQSSHGHQSTPPLTQPLSVGSTTVSSKVKQGIFKVCKPCLNLEYSCDELANHFCMKPFAHDGMPEASVVWDEKEQCLLEIQPHSLPMPSLGSFGFYSPFTFGQPRDESSDTLPTARDPPFILQQPLIQQTTGKISELSTPQSPSLLDTNRDKKNAVTLPKPFIPNKEPTPPTVVMATASIAKLKDTRVTPTKRHPVPVPVPVAGPVPVPVLVPSTENIKTRNAWKCKFQERLSHSDGFSDDFEEELTRKNYREKFYQLLCYEESEHITLLTEKCDGQYEFMFYGEKQPNNTSATITELGCIRGMDGDQIQYATQASEGLYLVDPVTGKDICQADLSEFNFFHTIDEDFKVELSARNARALRQANLPKVRGDWFRVGVEFEVKHSYFDTLHRAVISVPQSIIEKILPIRSKIPSPSDVSSNANLNTRCDREEHLTVDGYDQLQALEAIVSFPPSTPLILSGPFGSGKTRILARSAFEFGMKGLRTKSKVRILISAHHYETVNVYKKYLTSAFKDIKRVKIIKIIRRKENFQRDNWSHRFQDQNYQQNSNYHEKTLGDFRRDIADGAYMKDQCIIVMATYMTSLNISDVLSSHVCSFTHILLDEAAQAREPEAISSLCAAGTFTKVVIAGDSKQVGPYVVVLGDKARDHGLKKSLLERLEEYYNSLGPPLTEYIRRLTINYRCHPLLTSLLSDTLYSDHPITCGDTTSLVHPINPQSPCVFHCYDATNEQSATLSEWGNSSNERMIMEADALIGQLNKYFKYMPSSKGWYNREYKDICIVSPNRNQLNLIKRNLSNASYVGKRRVSLLTSYSVQGHEFEAIFVSTLEHLDDDGTPSNPTKSLVTPRIFNTILSRSKSLVVAVGNPFALLEIEKKMGRTEQCWKKYIKSCLRNNSFTYENKLTGVGKIDEKLRQTVGVKDGRSPVKQMKNKTQHDDESMTPWQTVSRTKSPQQLTASSNTTSTWSYPGTEHHGNTVPPQQRKKSGNTMTPSSSAHYYPNYGDTGRYTPTRRFSSGHDGRPSYHPSSSRPQYQQRGHGNRYSEGDRGTSRSGINRPMEQLSIGDYISNNDLLQHSKRHQRKKKK